MKTFAALSAACLMLGATIAPALADHEENLIIINSSSYQITSVSIKPGKVIGSKSVSPQSKKSFKIQVPDGVCDVQMITTWEDGYTDKNKIEVCGGMTFTWSNGRF
jgi:hypothetical protein